MTIRSAHIRGGGAAAAMLVAGVGLVSTPLMPSAAAATRHSARPATSGTTISTRSTKIGLIVVGAKRRTVYLFTRDGRNSSKCNRTCRADWPPVRSKGTPQAAAGIKQRKLGRTASHQVTYYGHPLYYFAGDSRAGQANGQGAHEFRGRWWVVSPQGQAGRGTTVRLHSTKFGNVVAGPKQRGRTVYMLSSDTRHRSTCTGGCASTWPPLTTTGRPHAGAGITASRLSTLDRSNGTRQVVYNGHPLYYYSGDSKAGQARGQCQTFPAPWYVLTKSGKPHTACTAGTGGSGDAACNGAPSSTPYSATIATARKKVGSAMKTIGVDGRGCTVYRYSGDTTSTPTCLGPCASTWPPVTTSVMPTSGSGLSCTLGTTTNGTATQVTCNGHPLYFFVSDARSSDASGENVNGFQVIDGAGNTT